MAAVKRFPATNSKIFKLVCESLREMRQTQGVPAYEVCDVVSRNYEGGGSPPNTMKLRAALQRGVQDGYLCYNNRRYNLEIDRCRSKCPPKSKPGLVKRIKSYLRKMMKSKCKPCKKRSKKSKKCKSGRRRKSNSRPKRQKIQKRKQQTSRCGC